MKFRPSPNQPDIGFQIAPMIDVVFVIMLFFMVIAGQTKTENELKMKLPSGDGDPAAIPDELTVAIAADGAITLNDSPVSTASLVREVALIRQNAANSRAKLLVTIAAEETTPYGKISAVLDALAQARASEHVTFAIDDTH